MRLAPSQRLPGWEETDPPERPVPRPPALGGVLRTEEPDAVAWLVVLGTGTWGYADSRCRMRTFPAGVHRVCQETVDFAVKANSPRLIVSQDEPVVEVRSLPGPLGPQHIRLPSDGSVILSPILPEVAAEVDSVQVPHAYPCGRCVESFPSAAARDRHVELHHEAG